MLAQTKKALPGLIAFALVAAAALLLSRPRVLYGNPTGEVPLELPDQLGPYVAEDLFFCSSEQCGRSFLASELEAAEADATNAPPSSASAPSPDGAAPAAPVAHAVGRACPECGSPLSRVSVGEMNLLPDSTPVFRRVYRRPGGPDLTVTVVFSGVERRSIHRPQRCLVSQGNRITDEYSRDCANGPGSRMELRILEFGRPDRTGDDPGNIYAYWLFNPERETVYHSERFLRMMYDNCFRAYRPRWGYASIALARDRNRPDAWQEELDAFLPRLYPVLQDVRRKLDAQRGVTVRLDEGSAAANVYDGASDEITDHTAARP